MSSKQWNILIDRDVSHIPFLKSHIISWADKWLNLWHRIGDILHWTRETANSCKFSSSWVSLHCALMNLVWRDNMSGAAFSHIGRVLAFIVFGSDLEIRIINALRIGGRHLKQYVYYLTTMVSDFRIDSWCRLCSSENDDNYNFWQHVFDTWVLKGELQETVWWETF